MATLRASAADPDALIGAGATVREALDLGGRILGSAAVESATTDAEWLLADVLGLSRTGLVLQPERTLSSPYDARYAHSLRRRRAREPLQHILGTQAFRGLTLRVGRDAMVPRPETELLVEWALELLPPEASPLVLDVGTGTGCVACAIASERPRAQVIALELSPAAAALARANVTALGLAVTVVESDLFAEVGRLAADLIVANPPYLPSSILPMLPPEVSRYDPWLALDGGADGLDVTRRIVAGAPTRLAPGGALVLETAGGEHVPAVVGLLDAAGFVDVRTRPDLAGVERFVAGRTTGCRPVS
jgi:release factor glutamine methyltransferase